MPRRRDVFFFAMMPRDATRLRNAMPPCFRLFSRYAPLFLLLPAMPALRAAAYAMPLTRCFARYIVLRCRCDARRRLMPLLRLTPRHADVDSRYALLFC